MQILHWPINPELKRETEEHYRTRLARELADNDPLYIIRQITFDDVAPNIEIADLEKLIDYVERHFVSRGFRGVGLEVGAGPLTFSSVLARRPSVQKVYGVEVTDTIIELLAPKVSAYILGDQHDKVVGVVGDFDAIGLPDGSVDFVVDYFSLHHSSDIKKTIGELYRVLKKGGCIVCFDKARPDSYTEKDLEELVDSEYGPADKKRSGVPLDQRFTRRMNGEKEYRLKDWRAAFVEAGFSRFEHAHFAKIVGGNVSKIIKRGISMLPPKLQMVVNRYIPYTEPNHKFLLSRQNKIFFKGLDRFPKEFSLMMAWK